jgi:hypothetical protein
MANKVFLCDIDGTIADIGHRLKFIQSDKPDWDAFFAACPEDKPIPEVIELLQCLNGGEASIIMVSGRSDAVCLQTHKWLHKWHVPYEDLLMRRHGDHRQDHIVKAELLDRFLEENPGTEVIGIFEDRKQVVDMWRARGLKCYQVAEGNF